MAHRRFVHESDVLSDSLEFCCVLRKYEMLAFEQPVIKLIQVIDGVCVAL